MTKFVLLAHGTMDPTPEFRQAHQAWWASMQSHVIDAGNPLVNGRTVAKDGSLGSPSLSSPRWATPSSKPTPSRTRCPCWRAARWTCGSTKRYPCSDGEVTCPR